MPANARPGVEREWSSTGVSGALLDSGVADAGLPSTPSYTSTTSVSVTTPPDFALNVILVPVCPLETGALVLSISTVASLPSETVCVVVPFLSVIIIVAVLPLFVTEAVGDTPSITSNESAVPVSGVIVTVRPPVMDVCETVIELAGPGTVLSAPSVPSFAVTLKLAVVLFVSVTVTGVVV